MGGRRNLREELLRVVVVGTVLIAAAAVPAHGSTQNQAGAPSPCAEYTDSVKRLYQAYFERLPDDGGFEFWVDKYSTGAGLADMSEFFAVDSKEFLDLYGDLSDPEFVEVLYQSVLGRDADDIGRDFWVEKLDSGIRRGTLMLSFSESEEFVEKTNTMVPAAGYLRWFAKETNWDCRQGSGSVPLDSPTRYADVAITNSAAAPASARVEVIGSNGGVLRVVDVVIQGGTARNVANLATFGASSIRVTVSQESGALKAAQTGESAISFSVARYTDPLPDDRPGWSPSGVPVPSPPPSPPTVPEPPVEEPPVEEPPVEEPPVEEPPVEEPPVEEPPPSIASDIAGQGKVEASSTFQNFEPTLAVDGDPSTSWFSTGPGTGDAVFVWSGPVASITEVLVTGNSEHVNREFRTGFGFELMQVEVLLDGEVVFSETVSMDGSPDVPPPVDTGGVTGDQVRLVLSGHEDPACGGFAELNVMALI